MFSGLFGTTSQDNNRFVGVAPTFPDNHTSTLRKIGRLILYLEGCEKLSDDFYGSSPDYSRRFRE